MTLQSHETVLKELKELSEYLTARFGLPIGSGRNRTVWKTNKGNVVKAPRNWDGVVDNEFENSTSDESLGYEILGKTGCFYVKGIPILVMEYLKDASREEIDDYIGSSFDWTGSIDCGQVGFNKDGQLRAYDYGRM